MTPAQRCRLAIAMTALAAYGCGDQPDTTIVEAGAGTTTTEHHNPQAADPTYADWDGLARLTTTTARAARSRPRPAGQSSQTLPAGTGDVWARLRDCENGGRYTSDPGDYYRGAYQFKQSTWESLGYTGDPADAPPHVQDEAARRLQARSGWGQWPRCSRKLGLG